MFNPATLWEAPIVNPVNRKARSIPALNPVNVYGRVFTFSWFGFMVAFWSWYVQLRLPSQSSNVKHHMTDSLSQVCLSTIGKLKHHLSTLLGKVLIWTLVELDYCQRYWRDSN